MPPAGRQVLRQRRRGGERCPEAARAGPGGGSRRPGVPGPEVAGRREKHHKGPGPAGGAAGLGVPHGARGGASPRAVARQGLKPPTLGWTELAPLASVRHFLSLLCPSELSRRPPPSFPSRFTDFPAAVSLSHTHAHAFTRHKGKGLPAVRGGCGRSPGHTAGAVTRRARYRCPRPPRAPSAAETPGGGSGFASRETLPLSHVFEFIYALNVPPPLRNSQYLARIFVSFQKPRLCYSPFSCFALKQRDSVL